MANQLSDLLVAGYSDIDTAAGDFDALVERVAAKELKIDAAILVSHDEAGNVTVQPTGDDRGRQGAGWGGAVGFLVGLAAPPRRAAVAVGAAGRA